MPATLKIFRRWAAAALAAGLLAAATGAAAASHALILWIGDYGSADLNLPGLEVDARNAREIARLMGVPSQNVREVANRTLTRQRIAAELAELDRRIAPGDRVFVYYSGHADSSALHLGEHRLLLSTLDERMQHAGAKVRLLIVDACRAGSLTRVKGDDDPLRASGYAVVTAAAAAEGAGISTV